MADTNRNRQGGAFARFTAWQRSLLSACAGFIFYGGWAYWINSAHGSAKALMAACVQGSYSFLLTLVMTVLLETLFRLNARLFNHHQWIKWSTIMICCAIIFSGSWAINAAAGTPEILMTVILGYVVGGIYSIVYVQSLASGKKF